MNIVSLINSILTAALSSGIAVGLVIWILKAYLKKQIDHHFERQMEELKHQFGVETERLKSELAIRQETEHELTARRLKAYPKLVEQVYRIRNMARETVSNRASVAILKNELRSRVNALEEELYEFRIDLNRDGVFAEIHAFKNLGKSFCMLMDDLQFQLNEDMSSQKSIEQKMQELYPLLDQEYLQVVNKLSALGPLKALGAQSS